MEEKEINLIDLFIVLMRNKRLIIGGTFALGVLTLAACFIVSPVFTAKTTVLPPQQNNTSVASQMLGQLGSAASMILGTGVPAASGDLFVGLVKDNAVIDPIIDKFELMKRYDLNSRVETRKRITEKVLKADRDTLSGIVSISVDDTDPQRAADLANAFADGLKTLLEKLAVTEAGVRRIFFERELKKSYEELGQAEEALQGFMETTGAIKIDEQAAAVLQGMAALKANIVSKEVQLQVMKTYATASNPDLKRAEEELEALKEQLRQQAAKEPSYIPSPLMSTSQIPAIGTEYLRKMRDFKYKEILCDIVKKQYESARLDEGRDAVVVQVIQRAIPPDKKSKPVALIMLVLSMVAGGGLFTTVAVGKEIIQHASSFPENARRFQEIRRSFARL